MHCPSCGFANPEDMKFCGQCGTPLSPTCLTCGFVNPLGFTFCGQCGTTLARQTFASGSLPLVPRSQVPRSYTPPHLADKIVTSKSASGNRLPEADHGGLRRVVSP
jgi:hypothetical protein